MSVDIGDSHGRPRPRAPSPGVRLFAAWFLGLIKGAVLSALALLPFFGPWAMAAGALAFSLFCLGLALKRGDCPGCAGGENTTEITQADTCYPKVRR